MEGTDRSCSVACDAGGDVFRPECLINLSATQFCPIQDLQIYCFMPILLVKLYLFLDPVFGPSVEPFKATGDIQLTIHHLGP
jgi:hypothetical protein